MERRTVGPLERIEKLAVALEIKLDRESRFEIYTAARAGGAVVGGTCRPVVYA